MKALILTEGGKDKGFGHITRCLSFFDFFIQSNIEVSFIVDGDESLNSLLKNKNFKLLNWKKEKSSLEKLLNDIDIDIDIVVIDSYQAEKQLYENISKKVDKCIYIDDYNRLEYPLGYVLNGSLGAHRIKYPEIKGVKYLLGIKYQPIRKEFWNLPQRNYKNNLKSVLITFGGTDNRNLTPKLLESLQDKYLEIEKKVVIGNSYDNVDEIKKLADNKTELIFNADAEKMKNLMLNCDFAISSAGQTIYELLATGTPSIIIGMVDNQKNNVDGLIENKLLNFAGWWDDEKIIEKTFSFLNELKNNSNKKNLNKNNDKFPYSIKEVIF